MRGLGMGRGSGGEQQFLVRASVLPATPVLQGGHPPGLQAGGGVRQLCPLQAESAECVQVEVELVWAVPPDFLCLDAFAGLATVW